MTNETASVNNAPAALIVDDSPVARRALAALLTQLGFRIYTAGSAEAALERLDERVPDVVFMDHLLPEADGLTAVRQIRNNPVTQRLPVVMYTSMETRQFARAARAAGADDVLFKSGAGASLEVVLSRLGLAPDGSSAASETEVPSNLPAALNAALRRHREEMREELLAEFAIMERHEETIRKELVGRVDSMTRQTVRAVEDQFRKRRVASAIAEQARQRTSWAIAACLAVVFGASVWANVAMWQQVKALSEGSPASIAPVASEHPMRTGLQVPQDAAEVDGGGMRILTASAVSTNWARPPVDH